MSVPNKPPSWVQLKRVRLDGRNRFRLPAALIKTVFPQADAPRECTIYLMTDGRIVLVPVKRTTE